MLLGLASLSQEFVPLFRGVFLVHSQRCEILALTVTVTTNVNNSNLVSRFCFFTFYFYRVIFSLFLSAQFMATSIAFHDVITSRTNRLHFRLQNVGIFASK